VPPLWEQILGQAMPIGLRVAGVMSFAPFLGSLSVPARIKAALTLALTALLFSVVPAPHAALEPLAWTRFVLSEAVLGLMLGLCLLFVFEAAQLAGQIAGFQIGFSLVNIIDPQTQVDTPVLSIFHQLVALLLFLGLNVHHWILRGLVNSFTLVPVGSVRFSPGAAGVLLHAAGSMWMVGVQIAAPILLVTLLMDVTVGFLSKASPQLPALFFSIPLKNSTGILVLSVAVGMWPGLFEKQFARALELSERLLHLAR
jgi:flagellar biosynthetic protein FliR